MLEKHDVVIVGAGAAGMSAAHELRDLDVLVLEAEDYAGGRTRSEKWDDGSWLNLGAQFHDADSEWAKRVGVALHSGPPPPPAVYWHGRMVVEKSRTKYFLKLPMSLGAKLSLTRTYLRLLPDLRRYPDVRPELEGKSLLELTGRLHPEAKKFFDLWAPSAGARDISELPAGRGLSTMQLAFGSLVRRGVLMAVVDGGTAALFAPVVRELGERLSLGARVTRIENNADGVVVTYLKDGEEISIQARACVCTATTSTVLRIVPEMSVRRREAMQQISFVPLVTIALKMEPQRPAPWDRFYWLKVEGTYISNVLNYEYFLARDRRPNGASLSILATSDPADRLLELSDDEAFLRVGDEFRNIFPEASQIVDMRIARWPEALHQVPLHLQPELEQLYTPDGSLFLAGEYLEGGGVMNAINSGRKTSRAVRQLLTGTNAP